jgi:DNA modification methylase
MENLALNPALELVVVSRKPLSEKTIAENVLKHGTGGINIEESRVPTDEPRQKIISKSEKSDNVFGDGMHGSKSLGFTETQGRFPANLIHDGSEEVTELFPYTKSGAMKRSVDEYAGESNTGFLRGKSGPENQHGDEGSAARFFYEVKQNENDFQRGNTMENLTLHNGDCLEVLKTIEDNTVDSIVTDPPYGIDFMGKKWDYDVPSVEIWEQCLRVLKPGGHLLAFAGTRTQHRMAVRIEDAGFEIRDMIAWVYGSGFPKSHNISKAIDKMAGVEREVVGRYVSPGETLEYAEGRVNGGTAFATQEQKKTFGGMITEPATDDAKKWEGWGTALKPALEPITVARKPIEEKSVAENVLKHGTGAINVDESRVATGDNLNGGAYAENSNRSTLNSDERTGAAAGMFQSSKNVGSDFEQPIGRFPANLIHDGSEEVSELFPYTKSGALPSHQIHRTYVNTYQGGWKQTDDTGRGFEANEGSAARFFYVPKTSKKDRNDGLESFEEKTTASAEFRPNHMEKAESGEDGNPYGRWTPTKNNHPTVKPTDLMRYLVNMVTPKGGTTLDPFMGSGSTGRGAVIGGFNFIGIELDPEYYEIAKARIAAAENMEFNAPKKSEKKKPKSKEESNLEAFFE